MTSDRRRAFNSTLPARTKEMPRTGFRPVVIVGSGAPVADLGQARQRKRIKPVSDKRARENRQRRAMIKALYDGERPLCAVWELMQPEWCARWADDAHEPLSRARGGGIADPGNHAPLCRPCHTLITDEEPDWAYAARLLIHSWDRPPGGAA